MRILALEPYYGGSHKDFLDGWRSCSQHNWTLLTLPAYKWKWRMRHSAITFAGDVVLRYNQGQRWDLIFCSDMLNLAEFLGLIDIPALPAIVYFHENQLTYPVRFESERDYQFSMTNLTTVLAARQVWFNSQFHLDSMIGAMETFLRRMPDFQPLDEIRNVRKKSYVYPPGIRVPVFQKKFPEGSLHILWCARWEHDKNPEAFFEAIKQLRQKGLAFKLSVIGEQFRDIPAVFQWAREYFSDQIVRWGYQESRHEYEKALSEADVIVSTAEHEFFGISMLEAVSHGLIPVLPKRLAYPDVFRLNDQDNECFFYDGTIKSLVSKLTELVDLKGGTIWQQRFYQARQIVERYYWPEVVRVLDQAIIQVSG